MHGQSPGQGLQTLGPFKHKAVLLRELLGLRPGKVEFLDRDGRTRCLASLSTAAILALNRQRKAVAKDGGLTH
jgi:hypothetical protein